MYDDGNIDIDLVVIISIDDLINVML